MEFAETLSACTPDVPQVGPERTGSIRTPTRRRDYSTYLIYIVSRLIGQFWALSRKVRNRLMHCLNGNFVHFILAIDPRSVSR